MLIIDKIRGIVELNSLDANFNNFYATSYEYNDSLTCIPNEVYNYVVMYIVLN
jgi:hypothetical protein